MAVFTKYNTAKNIIERILFFIFWRLKLLKRETLGKVQTILEKRLILEFKKRNIFPVVGVPTDRLAKATPVYAYARVVGEDTNHGEVPINNQNKIYEK